MTNVEVTGSVVPRLSRRDVAAFVRKVLIALEKLNRLDDEITDVSVAFVDDATMRRLNRKFRRKYRTTDVLTFPADDSYADPKKSGRPLGDIVISIDRALRQAVREKHSTAIEVRYLLVHGVLHALGYDHETDHGEMNQLEIELRAEVGLD
ncbi:MAG TPA: rRNA maturation RNase YbeY [Thermoanaerobaculia bacterium]